MSRRIAYLLTGFVLLGAIVAVLLALNPLDESQAGGGYLPGLGGQAPAPEGITVAGVGSARLERPARRSDRTIGLAVAAAERAAFPKAALDARAHAESVARSVGLGVGAVESVAETEDPYTSGAYGRFGPGRYCGVLPRRFYSHRRWVHRVPRHRTCIVPRESVVVLTVRFAKG
jgi:hypothetical protein